MKNPNAPVRSEVVALLLDVDFEYVLREPPRWQRYDGRPLTAAEQDLAQSATEAELLAAGNLSSERRIHADELEAAWQRLLALIAPFTGTVPKDTPMVQIALLLPPADKAEFDRLLEIVAPGGLFFVPSGH